MFSGHGYVVVNDQTDIFSDLLVYMKLNNEQTTGSEGSTQVMSHGDEHFQVTQTNITLQKFLWEHS